MMKVKNPGFGVSHALLPAAAYDNNVIRHKGTKFKNLITKSHGYIVCT